MKMNKKIWIMMIALTVFAAGYSDLISVNIMATGTAAAVAGTVDTNKFTGAVSDLNWNNCQLTNIGVNVFSNIGGNGMNVTVTYSATANNASASAWDGWVNRNGAAVGNGAPVTVSLENIPYAEYYVIVYVGGYGSGYDASISDGTSTKSIEFMYLASSPSLMEAVTGGTGSYVVFGSTANPLTSDSLTLTMTRINGSPCFAGFQIVQIPEPATMSLFLISGCGIFGSRYIRRYH